MVLGGSYMGLVYAEFGEHLVVAVTNNESDKGLGTGTCRFQEIPGCSDAERNPIEPVTTDDKGLVGH
jgi:hypothetical protein